jgi:hypothetical protein
MRQSLISRVLIVVAMIGSVALLAPTAAVAREGARSVGKGVKCSARSVLQADGTYKVQQVCYKSV